MESEKFSNDIMENSKEVLEDGKSGITPFFNEIGYETMVTDGQKNYINDPEIIH